MVPLQHSIESAKMVDKLEDIILTAGPSITGLEIEYVTDAVVNGWNHHHSDYIKKFEAQFAEYVGAKHALATSSCTGALHIALLSLGVGPGDEVIIPECTWIATASAVVYTGATPVFADIRADSWVMDAEKVSRLITPRTKVIIPVHLYGHPVEMEALWALADKHGISILEDAAPSIGARYKGRRTGSLGRAAAFSFQGAKALVTGEGGMLVTSDDALMERARFLNDHGRDPKSPLAAIEIGYKYKMSNMQGALGLAQIQRADEIVNKKRQLFEWYRSRLADVEEITLNVERPECFSIYWMSSMVLGPKIKIGRDEFMKQLKERMVDTRPFFEPISSFPMFKGVTVDNPVAYDVPRRAINLPSGHNRTEEEVDYICAHIRELVGKKLSHVSVSQPAGWLAAATQTIRTFKELKGITKGPSTARELAIKVNGDTVGALEPITVATLDSEQEVELLAKWRDKAQPWFPSQFKVTKEGTKNWVDKQLLRLNDRILFYVKSSSGERVGHVGLFRFDFAQQHCEIDNIVRGEDGWKGALEAACATMMEWAFSELGMKKLFLRVVSDNQRAITLYERLGFEEIQRVPLRKVQGPTSTRWVEVVGRPYEKIERYFVTMAIPHERWSKRSGS